MMFRVRERVYRTNDGRLVPEGDEAAAFLAFAVGDEVTDAEARRVGLTAFGAKARPRAEDKAAATPANKAGGLTINRATSKGASDG